MKKIFTTLAAAMSALALMATTYTGQLTVTVDGEGGTQDGVEIDVTNNGDIYNLTIRNFILDGMIPVGNIVVENVLGQQNDGITLLGVSRNIVIDEGDDPNFNFWMGPSLGLIPINMVTTIAGNYLVTDINIDMSDTDLGQVISVHFSNDINGTYRKQFQMPNSDFEEWTEKTAEPRHWHGFNSATGNLLSFSQSATVEKDTDVRPGSTGTSSAKIGSNVYKIFGFVASAVNGTMTNGRLKAASTSASSSDNCSFAEYTEKDKNGENFYTELLKEPDQIKAWFKFNQAKANADYPYATISAIVYDKNVDCTVDGETKKGYLQDPEPKKGTNKTGDEQENYYDNVVAKAQNRQIPTGDWREVVIPFDYDNAKWSPNELTGNAILVTMSTNAGAGQGTQTKNPPYDYLWVDDMELVYNASITNVELNGITLDGFAFDAQTKHNDLYYEGKLNISPENFVVTLNGRSAVAAVCINDLGDGNYQVAICATSPDMVNNDLYTINLTRVTPVADVLAKGVELQDYILKEDMKVVAESDVNGVAGFVTDGTHWMRLNFFGQDICPTVGTVMGHIKGTYNGNALAPAIDVLSYEDGTSSISENVRTINLAHNFAMPVASEVANVIGWYEEGGTLRGFAGNPGGQSLSLYNEFDPMGTSLDEVMEAGKQYKVVVAFEIKEAWAAPRRINSADYDYDFQNLTGVVLGSPEELLPTAVENVEAASEVKSVRYIDAMGRVHNAPVDGINIVVTEMANGTTTTVKVVR